MAFNFPADPAENQVFASPGGPVYIYKSPVWTIQSMNSAGGGAIVTIGDAAPANPVAGQVWWESDTGNTFIWYNDGNTAQWVQANLGVAIVADFVKKAGDVMTGALTLSGNPVAALDAVPQQYVDTVVNGVLGLVGAKVAKAGDTMTGVLTIQNSLVVRPAAASPQVYLDAASAAVYPNISSRRSDLAYAVRWQASLGDVYFNITPYTDAGVQKTAAVSISRADSSAAFTGDVTISKAAPAFLLNKTADGQAAVLRGMRDGVWRWSMHFGDSSSETGSNAGSAFLLNRHTDAGVGDNMLALARNTDVFSIMKGQLGFPATQNPSAAPNVLDDYEEGLWTPSLKFAGNSVGMTYTSQQGRYIKVGGACKFWVHITLGSKGSSVGTATITGLPFVVSSSAVGFHAAFSSYLGAMVGISGTLAPLVQGTTTAIALYQPAGQVVNDANFAANSDVYIAGEYEVQ